MNGTITVEVQADYTLREQGRGIAFQEIRVCLQAPGLQLLNKDHLPNQNGLQLISVVLASGLINNIHYGHHLKMRDSAEHLRFFIRQLEDQFVLVPEVTFGKYATGEGGKV